jgi:hypothetical protein
MIPPANIDEQIIIKPSDRNLNIYVAAKFRTAHQNNCHDEEKVRTEHGILTELRCC